MSMRMTPKDRLLAGLTALGVVTSLGILLLVIGQVLIVGSVTAVSPGFLTENPSSDMLGGGVFPAIYGTIAVTLIMTIAVVPIGIAAAVWLNEYASVNSRFAALVRLAVQNLAGVPSIVFGLFGLGFFVLFIGGQLDSWFYGDADGPVWSKPGLLWSSLTLAVLTLPTLIVTTEESLKQVSSDLRAGSLALGATRFQTVYKIVLPQARAGILTGVILAISRGAGEVAPIMVTGAANFIPYLPTDARDMFMHLGYHVFALATQSPNVDAARPVLFGTSLVLLVLTFALNLIAIVIRSRLRAKAKH